MTRTETNGAETLELGRFNGTGEDEFPIIDAVPVDVGTGAQSTGGGFPRLSRTADERHLSVVRKMFDQQGIAATS